ncbi:MAG: PilN domain-containing protein [Candidatus Omnitrophica bacterium]|nr:PilN domain-containing protein [Candidatus Omnitrophota bacterium]
MMIDINLIPAALRKNGKGNVNSLTINIPHEIFLGVGSALVLLMLTAHLSLGAIWLAGISRLSGYRANWQKVLPDKTELDSMNKESVDLKKKIRMISDMTTKKSVLWAPKFNAISDDLPKGLWIRKMVLDKSALTIEGSVVSKNQNEINNVGLFLSTLKQNDSFMKDFSSLEVNSIQRGNNNAVDVTDFRVMAKLK